mmetsp:Transcript_31912/g.77766  ORF Transcript_31912/g.77766 Transcript_31912/m.77766 type:complete len:1081 (-) Transcript_31912:172-3414(-)
MWGQLSNLVGNETLENITGTVSNIARDLGNLEDDDYDDDFGDRNEELAAQSIELKDYKEEVMQLRQALRKSKLDHSTALKAKEKELAAFKKKLAEIEKGKPASNGGAAATAAGGTGSEASKEEAQVSYKEYLELQKKAQQVKRTLENRLGKYRKVTSEQQKLLAQEQSRFKDLHKKLQESQAKQKKDAETLSSLQQKLTNRGDSEKQMMEKLVRLSGCQQQLADVEIELGNVKGRLKIAQRQSQEAISRCASLTKENVGLKEEQDQLKDENARLERGMSKIKRTMEETKEQEKFLSRKLARSHAALEAKKAECLALEEMAKPSEVKDDGKIEELKKTAESHLQRELTAANGQLEAQVKEIEALKRELKEMRERDSLGGGGSGEGTRDGITGKELKELKKQHKKRVDAMTQQVLEAQAKTRELVDSREELEERTKQAERMVVVQKTRIASLTSDRDNLVNDLKKAKDVLGRQEERLGNTTNEVVRRADSLERDLNDAKAELEKLRSRQADAAAAHEMHAASRHALASALQDITDLVVSFSKHHGIELPKPSTDVPFSPTGGELGGDDEEHLVFGKAESKLALEVVRSIISRAAVWVSDSKDKESAVARAKANAAEAARKANLEIGEAQKHCADQMAKLQADCEEAFKREEAARRKAALAEAARARMEEEHAEIVQQLEETEQQISDSTEKGKQTTKTLETQLREAKREASKLRAELRSAKQEAELHARQVEERDRELNETYAELKDANARVANMEENGIIAEAEGDEALESELAALRQRLQEADERVRELEDEIATMGSLASDFAGLQRRFDQQKKENERMSSALQTMQTTIEQMEKDAEEGSKSAKQQKDEAKVALKTAEEAKERISRLQEQLNQSEAKVTRVGRELTGTQRYVLKLESENSALRKGYEKMMQKLRELSSEGNMVDRRLVVKLIVTYFQQGYSNDVLDLMSRMLHFTEEEKIKVGLGSTVLGRTLNGVSSWLSSMATMEGENEGKGNLDDKNLADLWVDFLMQETEQERARDKSPEGLREQSRSRTRRNFHKTSSRIGTSSTGPPPPPPPPLPTSKPGTPAKPKMAPTDR